MRDDDVPFFEAPPLAAPRVPTTDAPVPEVDFEGVASPRAGDPPPLSPDGLTTTGFFRIGPSSLRGLPKPLWILLGYLFLGHSAIDEEWPAIGAFHPRLLLGVLALCFVAPRVLSELSGRSGPRSEHASVSAWLVALTVAGVLATLWAFDPGLAKDAQIEHMTEILVYFLIVAIVRTRREVLVTVLVLAAAFGFYLLRSFTEYLAGKHQYTMGVSRMMGAGQSHSDPNSFAATLAFTMPLLLWAAVHARSRFLQFCVLVYGLLSAACVIQTHSRSGLILVVLNVLFAFWMLPGVKTRIAMAALIVGLGAYLATGQTDNALERYESIVSSKTYTKESSTVGRIEGYRVAWRIFQDNPLFGVGPGCWSVYRKQRVDGDPLYPHNMPGQLLATVGAVGVVAFVGYLISVIAFTVGVRRRRAASLDPWDRAVRSLTWVTAFTFVLLLVSGTAAHNLERPAWYLLPALLAVAARARRLESETMPGASTPGASPGEPGPDGVGAAIFG